DRARTDRVHMPPVALLLRMLQRIAVALRSRGQQELRVVLFRDLQAVEGSRRPDSQRLDAVLEVIDRAGRRSEMKQVVDVAGIEGLADILRQKFEARLVR